MVNKFKFQFSLLIVFNILLSVGILSEVRGLTIALHFFYFILYGIIVKEFVYPTRLNINNFYLYFGLLASQSILPFYFSKLNLSIITLYMLPLFLLLRFSHRDSISIKDMYKNKVAAIFILIGLLEFIHLLMQYSSVFRVAIILDSLSYISTGLLVFSFSKIKIDSNKMKTLIKFIIFPLLLTMFLSFIISDLNINSISSLYRLGDYNNEGSNSFALLMLIGALLSLQLIRIKKTVLVYFIFGLFVFALFLTKTLSVLIPFILFSTSLFLKRNTSFVVTPLLIMVVLFFSTIDNISDLTKLRKTGDNQLIIRGQLWSTSLNLISENPVLGVTRDEFDRNVLHVYSDRRNESIGLTPHNVILNITLYNGIIIGLLFISVLIMIVIRNFRFIKDPRKKVIAILIIVSIISHMSMDAWFYIYFALMAFTFSDFNTRIIDINSKIS